MCLFVSVFVVQGGLRFNVQNHQFVRTRTNNDWDEHRSDTNEVGEESVAATMPSTTVRAEVRGGRLPTSEGPKKRKRAATRVDAELGED